MTLNLAPMVDVMMCLIIFFLLASRLVSAQYRGVELARAASAQEIERSALGPKVVVNIRPTGGPAAAAEYVVLGWDGRRATERVLNAGELVEHLRTRAAERGEPRCVVRADREVSYADVETVLRACGLAGLRRIVFSAHASAPAEGSP